MGWRDSRGAVDGLLIMRILAFENGTIRVGVAVSDELGMVARPLEFILAAMVMRSAGGLEYVRCGSSH